MVTVIMVLGAALAIDAVLAADAKRALKRADLTLDYVSRVTGVPLQRLSDQLNGKTPFTSFWRLFTGEMRETDFLCEFLDIQAARVERIVVPNRQIGDVLARLDFLLGGPKPMVKATLHPHGQKEQAG